MSEIADRNPQSVRLEGERIADYAIVAPTEWNFHPKGALYRELEGRPARSEGAARRALDFAAATLDPCVALEPSLDTAESPHALRCRSPRASSRSRRTPRAPTVPPA